MPLSLEVKAQQKRLLMLSLGEKALGVLWWYELSCVPGADAPPVPRAEGRRLLHTCLEAHTVLNCTVGM